MKSLLHVRDALSRLQTLLDENHVEVAGKYDDEDGASFYSGELFQVNLEGMKVRLRSDVTEKVPVPTPRIIPLGNISSVDYITPRPRM